MMGECPGGNGGSSTKQEAYYEISRMIGIGLLHAIQRTAQNPAPTVDGSLPFSAPAERLTQ
jgi:hypothetical protein